MAAVASARSSPPDPERGASSPLRQIAGFQVLEVIGKGGMGAVLKARQTSMDRLVALKVLPPSLARNSQFIDRFQREARASAKLNHENIVQGIDVGRDPGTGLWYFAMEYVDGPSLKAVLQKEGPLKEQRALEIVRGIARALECAQKIGMVHRDIKPDNILMSSGNMPKLADLGLAKHMQDDPNVTLAGTAVGTPHYMAPEQVRGQSERIDVRTDLYSLGGTLFHLVTGQTPFSGQTGAVIMARQLSDTAPRANKVNPNVSEACSRLIARLLQKAPEKRVQSPGDLIREIDAILTGERSAGASSARHATHAKPVSSQSERRTAPATPKPKRPIIVAASAMAVTVLIGLVALFTAKRDNLENSEKKPVPVRVEAVAEKPQPEPVRLSPLHAPAPATAPEKGSATAFAALRSAELFSAAENFARSNPDDIDGILQRYSKLAEEPTDPHSAARARAAMTEIRQRRDRAASAALQRCQEDSEKLADSGDFDAALAKLDEMKMQDTYKLVAAQHAAARSALVEKAERAVKDVLKKAEQALEAQP